MSVMLDRTLDYVDQRREDEIRSNNRDLLELLHDFNMLNDTTEEEIAFVNVTMGMDSYWDESTWWMGNDDLVENCEGEDLLLNDVTPLSLGTNANTGTFPKYS